MERLLRTPSPQTMIVAPASEPGPIERADPAMGMDPGSGGRDDAL